MTGTGHFLAVASALTVSFLFSCGGAPQSTTQSLREKSAPEGKTHSTSAPLAMQVGHSADVYIAAFSPDGTLVATGDQTGAIELWDPVTGEVHALLEGHTANVTALAFSRDGKRLASGGEDGRVMVWDLEKGSRISVVEIPDRKVWQVALNPDGSVVAVRDNIGLSLNDANSGEPKFKYDASNAPGALLSPDGSRVIVGLGAKLQITDVASGKSLGEANVERFARDVRFSGDGLTLVSADSQTSSISIFDGVTGESRRTIQTSSRAQAISLDQKGTIVAAAIEGRGIDVFDARSGAVITTIDWTKHPTEWHFGMTADGQRIFLADRNNVQMFDAHTGKALAHIATEAARRIVVDPGRPRVAILGDGNAAADVWDGGRKTAHLEGAPERVRAANLFADGKTLAVVEEDSPEIVLWNLENATIRASLHSSLKHIYEAIPSVDGAHLFITGYGEAEIISTATGTQEKAFNLDHWSSQYQAAWSKSGEVSFLGVDDHTLNRFDKHLAALPPLQLGTALPTALAYSPDGTTLATAGPTGVQLIRGDAPPQLLVPPLNQPAYGLAWSPDAKLLVVGTEQSLFTIDIAARIRERDTPVAAPVGPPAPGSPTPRHDFDTSHGFVAAAFSDDGSHIVATERRGVIDLFTTDKVERSFHTHGTPWSIAFLSSTKSPVVMVAAGSLGFVRTSDGATVRLRSFMIDGKRVGFATGLHGVEGDPKALSRALVRSGAAVNSPLRPLDPSLIHAGLVHELGLTAGRL